MEKNFLSGLYLELLRAWPNRWLGIFVASAIVAVVAITVMAMPDQYESKSRVYVNAEVVLRPLLRGITPEDDPDTRENMLKILQSTVLNDRNIDMLLEIPELGFDVSTPSKRSKAIRAVRGGFKIVEQDDLENLYDLAYADTNGTRARNVLAGLLQVLLKAKSGFAQRDYDDAQKFLDAQIQEYQVKLQDLESQIAGFRLVNANLLGDTTTHQQRLAVALTALREAQLARKIAVANRDRIKGVIAASSQGKVGGQAIFATDQTFPAAIDRLGALQNQLNQLLLQYTDQHPDVIATKREIALLTEQYGLGENLGRVTQPFAPGQVAPSAAVDAAIGAPEPAPLTPASASPTFTPAAAETNSMQMQLVRANFAVLDAERKTRDAEAAVAAIQEQSGTAPAAEAQLDQLTREYAVVKENYEQLVRRRESAKITAAVDLSTGIEQFRVLEEPSLPTGPTSPDRPSILLLAALASVLAGGAIAYGLGLLRGTFVSANEAEQALGLPVIARLANTQGVITRASQLIEVLMLLGAIGGIFAAAYVISATSGWAAPIRDQIYQLFQVGIGRALGLGS